jgi:hypothetical protein
LDKILVVAWGKKRPKLKLINLKAAQTVETCGMTHNFLKLPRENY